MLHLLRQFDILNNVERRKVSLSQRDLLVVIIVIIW